MRKPKEMRCKHVSCKIHAKNVYNAFVAKPERKRPLERPSRRRVIGIKIFLTNELGGKKWIRVV
jgi:hypothetical protein